MIKKDVLKKLIQDNKLEIAPPKKEVWHKVEERINKPSVSNPLILSVASLFVFALSLSIYNNYLASIESIQVGSFLVDVQDDYIDETYEDEESLVSYSNL